VLKARAALGFRAHSGWAVMAALAGPATGPRFVRRHRIELADRRIPGSVQPYHAAEGMAFGAAEEFVRVCSDATAELARSAVRHCVSEMSGCEVRGACVLLASGRPLPGLAGILASHALIHAAEGEFYRSALREACESCGLEVMGVPERNVAAEAGQALGRAEADVEAAVAEFGRAAGRPWRRDEKLASLAAWLVLAGLR
jgi:hypothetical protein